MYRDTFSCRFVYIMIMPIIGEIIKAFYLYLCVG